MHLLSHFGSGFCVGAAASALRHKRKDRSLFPVPLLVAGGTLLPDLDAISVLFDHATYYSRNWYSHRGMLHSPLGVLPLVALVSFLIGGRGRARPRAACALWLYLGALLHLLEDLPTPRGPWGGLMLLFPFSMRRFGGWSHIYWQNEFLMVLFSLGAVGSAALLAFLARSNEPARARLANLLVAGDMLVLGAGLIFVALSRYESPDAWESYQRRLLPETLYEAAHSLNRVVRSIWSKEIL